MDTTYSRIARLNRRHFVTALATGSVAAGLIASGMAGMSPLRPRQAVAQESDGQFAQWGEGSDPAPSVPVCWRAIRQTAKPASEAEFYNRTLGFIWNDNGESIIVNNLTQGTEIQLNESWGSNAVAFNHEQDSQLRSGTAGMSEPVPYLNIDLIAADVVDDPDTVGTGELLDWSSPFTIPTAEVSLAFGSVSVTAGETVFYVAGRGNDGSQPVFLMCLEGSFNPDDEQGGDGDPITPGTFVELSYASGLHSIVGLEASNVLVGVTLTGLNGLGISNE